MKILGIIVLCIWSIVSTITTVVSFETKYVCEYKYNLARDNYCILLAVPKSDKDTIKLYLKDVYLLEETNDK